MIFRVHITEERVGPYSPLTAAPGETFSRAVKAYRPALIVADTFFRAYQKALFDVAPRGEIGFRLRRVHGRVERLTSEGKVDPDYNVLLFETVIRKEGALEKKKGGQENAKNEERADAEGTG